MNAVTSPRSVPLGHQPEMSVDLLRGEAQITAIAQEWRALFDRAAAPHQVFQSPAFLELWMRHYADERTEPLLLTGRMDGRLVIAMPLVRQRVMGLAVLRCMGLPVAQFSDCIAEHGVPQALADDLWAAVRGLGADLLELRRVREDSALARLLPAGEFEFEPQQSPFATLSIHVGDNGEPGEVYSAKYRSNVRRRMRRLAELGDVRLIAGLSPVDARPFAASAIGIKRLWLERHRMSSPTVHDDRFAAFFTDAAADPATGLQVSSITLDDVPVAIDLSFICKGVCFGHVLAADPAHEEHGVGALMIHQAFAAARARGCTSFDLLAPSDSYKMSHADGVTQVASRAYAFSPAGRLACGLLIRRAIPAARELAARLPTPLVNWIGRRL